MTIELLKKSIVVRVVSLTAAVVSLLAGAAAPIASGADPAFVGELALLAEKGVADEIGISEEVRKKLAELIDRREEEAIATALKVKHLSPPEQARMMAPFVRESEQLGMALLSDEQREKLKKIRLQRDGMATLAESEVATMLDLTDEQKAQIKTLLEERAVETAKGGDEERRVARAASERKLAAVLTKNQRIAWDVMVGLAPDAALAEAPAQEAETPEATQDNAAPAQPGPMPAAPVAAARRAEGAGGAEGPEGEVELRFNFAYQPWKDVLNWFAEQANLSLVSDSMPPGTFNYVDTARTYTPAEALDQLNRVLLTKGYSLVQHERMVMLINLEDGVPPALVETVPLDDLDRRGTYTLVKCLFDLKKLTPEAAQKEIADLIGPQGKVFVLPSSRKVLVQETAGNLRTIRSVLLAADGAAAELRIFDLKSVFPEDIFTIARQIYGIPQGEMRMADGSINFATDPSGSRIIASGLRDKLDRLDEIIKAIDREYKGTSEGAEPKESPQLEVYSVTGADPKSVYNVAVSLMEGHPDVQLATDELTGNLIAMARPSEHATIKATIDQLQRNADRVEVIKLNRVDVQIAIISINKLFTGDSDEEKAKAPKVDGDAANKLLYVRGSDPQIEQIKAFVERIDKDLSAASEPTFTNSGGTVRLLPITGRNARLALEQAQFMWSRGNPITIKAGAPAPGGRTSPAGGVNQDSRDQAAVDPAMDLRGGGDFQRQFPLPPELQGVPAANRGSQAQPGRGGQAPRRAQPQPRGGYNLPQGLPRDLKNRSTRRPAATPPAAPTAVTPQPASPASDQSTLVDPLFRGHSRETLQFVSQIEEESANASEATASAPDAAKNEAEAAPAATAETPAAEEKPAESPAPAEAAPPLPAPPAEAAPASPSDASTEPPQPFIPSERFRPDLPARPEAETDSTVEPGVSVSGADGVNRPGAEIEVLITPQGVIIKSDDQQALNEFQALLNQLNSELGYSGVEPVVFYLKYARADYASEMIREILGGVSSSSSGGGGLLGDMASSMFGGGGGGIMGALLSGGGGSSGGTTTTSTGSVTITPDTRLNALIVQGNTTDLGMIESLLEVIDQETSPESVQTRGRPRLIPVQHTSVDEIATVVRQVYADRIASTQSGGGGGQPNPQDFLRMLQQGARGGRNQGRTSNEDSQKMTLGVDARSNSLIVSAPESLYREVEDLVRTLDQKGSESNETIQVVTLQRSSADLVGRTVISSLGQNAQSSSVATNNRGQFNRNNQQRGMNQGQQGFGQFGGGNPFGGGGFQGGGFNRGGGGNPFGGGGLQGFGGGGNRGGGGFPGGGFGAGGFGGGNRGGGNRGGR